MALTTPETLQAAIEFFADADRCHAYMVQMRWPDGVVKCPTCGKADPRYLANQRRFECKNKHPKRQFSVKVGTIFEDSPIPLKSWLLAVWQITNCKNGISSYELARALGVTQKTAWFMNHRIRLAMQDKSGGGGKLNGEVEIDETFVGGKARNMSRQKRERVFSGRGRKHPMEGKVAVLGLLERHPVKGQVPHSYDGRGERPDPQPPAPYREERRGRLHGLHRCAPELSAADPLLPAPSN